MAEVYMAGDFRNGTTFEMDGNVYKVVEFQHVKPGKGAAFVRTKLKNVISGAVLEKTFNPSEKYPGAEIEKREMQYLYNDENLYYFMDNETYEQIPLNKEQLGDALKYIKENMNVKILSFKGNVFAVEPPMFVELEVTYTEPGFAGNTTTTSGKPATLENGYTINPNHYYRQFETSMDYLQKAIDKFRADKIEVKNLPFCEILKPMNIDWTRATLKRYNNVYSIIEMIKSLRSQIQSLYFDYKSKSKDEKVVIANEVSEIRNKYTAIIKSKSFSDIELYMLLREIDKDKNVGYARTIFDTLFATGNSSLYDMIRNTTQDIYKITKRTNENSVILFDYTYFKQKIG